MMILLSNSHSNNNYSWICNPTNSWLIPCAFTPYFCFYQGAGLVKRDENCQCGWISCTHAVRWEWRTFLALHSTKSGNKNESNNCHLFQLNSPECEYVWMCFSMVFHVFFIDFSILFQATRLLTPHFLFDLGTGSNSGCWEMWAWHHSKCCESQTGSLLGMTICQQNTCATMQPAFIHVMKRLIHII